MHRNVTVYEPADRPDIEVLIDGNWCVGEVADALAGRRRHLVGQHLLAPKGRRPVAVL